MPLKKTLADNRVVILSYREVNAMTVKTAMSIPTTEECIAPHKTQNSKQKQTKYLHNCAEALYAIVRVWGANTQNDVAKLTYTQHWELEYRYCSYNYIHSINKQLYRPKTGSMALQYSGKPHNANTFGLFTEKSIIDFGGLQCVLVNCLSLLIMRCPDLIRNHTVSNYCNKSLNGHTNVSREDGASAS